MQQEFIHPTTKRMKRAMDILGALIGLSLTFWLFPLIALAIKFDSPGPVLFRQTRVGRIWPDRMEIFEMMKFRSMCNDAEKGTGAVWATKGDPRVTRVGKFLRKTRLDELPQFLNVLKGDMSLIGPRPERPCISDNLENDIPFYKERTYGVTPGITGLAQIYQGYDETLDDVRSKLGYDLAYSLTLNRPAAWLMTDLKIVFLTIWIMITGRGQ